MMKNIKKLTMICLVAFALLLMGPAMALAVENGSAGDSALQTQTADVVINETNFPDATFRDYVKTNIAKGSDTLTGAVIDSTTSIDVSGMGIHFLNGIEYFTNLTDLKCGVKDVRNSDGTWTESYNDLLSLDVSKNTKLINLDCSRGQLTELDVSHNLALQKLTCYLNWLEKLDVSKNVDLRELSCSNNRLTDLDVSKNPELRVLNCPENQLTNLDISKNVNLGMLSCSENQLTALNLTKNKELYFLECYNNKISDLDLSNNTGLYNLTVFGNQLTKIDVSNNTELMSFMCNNNQLTTLDVSKNTYLSDLSCDNNQLKSLDVSNNTKLRYLACNNNQLATLDVSKNTKLTYLACNNNQLATLDVSKNTELTNLVCNNNQLYKLYTGNDPKLTDGFNYDAQQPSATVTYGKTTDGKYTVALSQLGMNAVDYANITMKDGGVLDAATGIVTYSALPLDRKMAYTYQIGYADNKLEVSLPLVGNGVGVSSLGIKTAPSKTNYQVNENLDLSGGVLAVTYSDGSVSELPLADSRIIVTGFDNQTAGTDTLVASYGGKTVNFNVYVDFGKLEIFGQTHVQNLGWTEILSGESLRLGTVGYSLRMEALRLYLRDVENNTYVNGLQYRTYCNGQWSPWSADSGTSGTTGQAIPIETVQIKLSDDLAKAYYIVYRANVQGYGWLDYAQDGGSAGTNGLKRQMEALDVQIIPKGTAFTGTTTMPYITGTFDSISVAQTPSRTEYEIGDALDLSGGDIQLLSKDSRGDLVATGQKSMTDLDVSATGFDSQTAGMKSVTITYQGKSTSFNVNVKEKKLVSVDLLSSPTKTVYQMGDKLDLSGGKIRLNYGEERLSGDVLSDDVSYSKEINMTDSGVTISGFDSATFGMKTLTVTYEGKTTRFNVEIEDNRTVPGKPTGLKATAGTTASDTVNLTWSAPASNGRSAITGYTVYRDGEKIGTTSGNGTSYQDSSTLTAGNTYIYTVSAVNVKGSSVASDPASATIPKRTDNSLVISCVSVSYGQRVVPTVSESTSNGTVTYEYSSDKETWSTNAPTEPGTYYVRGTAQATAEYEAKTSEPVQFIITTLTPTLSNLVATDIIVGQSLNDSTLTGVADVAGTFSWEDGAQIASTAGTSAFNAKFTPTDTTHYSVKDNIPVSVTVKESAPLVIACNSLVYDNGQTTPSPKALNNTTQQQVTYTYNQLDESGKVINSLGATPPTTVGLYEVVGTTTSTTGSTGSVPGWFRLASVVQAAETDGGLTTQDTTVTDKTYFRILPALPTITAPTASAITYGQQLSGSTLSGGTAKVNLQEIAGNFAWSNADATIKPNVGTATYNVVFTPTDTTNYKSVTIPVSVTTNMAEAPTPAAPVLQSYTSTTATVKTIPGQEYKINDGAWQASGLFTGLTEGTQYSIKTRVAATATAHASAESDALSFTTDSYLLGDINADNKINAIDALRALKHADNESDKILTGTAFLRGDVNFDNVVDLRDANQILNYSTGEITSFQ